MEMIQHRVNASTYVAEEFEAKDLGAPFKIVLHGSVKVRKNETNGDVLDYTIPDLDGLLAVIVFTRVLHVRKLTGPDIKYIRKLLGLKQKELASKIEMSVEHLSRCETGALVLSPSSEKLLRIFALKSALKLHKVKSCEAKTNFEEALDRLFDKIKPVAVVAVDDLLELHFARNKVEDASDSSSDQDDGPWEANSQLDDAA